MSLLTIDELADEISEGLPADQREANHTWLVSMHAMLKDGGVLGIPVHNRAFIKYGDCFEEIAPENVAFALVKSGGSQGVH